MGLLIYHVLAVVLVVDVVGGAVVTGCGNLEPSINWNNVYDVRDFGAIGDGRTLCTLAFQAAISAAATSSSDGGVVMVTHGHYLTGSVKLSSNVYLYVNRSAVIMGSAAIDDYWWNPATNMPVLVAASSCKS
jgi:polygalacturonase